MEYFMNILIWGAGRYCQYVIDCIKPTVNILAIIDSDERKSGRKWENTDIPIEKPEMVREINYDYIVVSAINYDSIKNKCRELGICQKSVIIFWEDKVYSDVIINRTDKILAEKHRADVYRARLDSAPYEWGLKNIPKLISAEECLKQIYENRYSLCRFGDGEYNIMLGDSEPWFQKGNMELKKRLCEIIRSEQKHILVAIAQNFENLDLYTESAADEIRLYMEGKKRDDILNLLGKNINYYDAYVSRPYLIYKDKSRAKYIFDLFKKIWNDRELILVEGQYTCFGVGNDLLDGTKKVERIICPFCNAWDKYSEIYSTVLKHTDKTKLVCISLGPVATVLAYDLACKGIQAIDIGQLDNEYEWYSLGVEERVDIGGKMVAELHDHTLPDQCKDEKYLLQVIERII